MDIINVTIHNTLWEELVILFIGAMVFSLLIGFIYLEYKNQGKLMKSFSWIATLAMIGLMVYSIPNNINRAYKFEIIEVKVSDWNSVMNNKDYEFLEKDGNILKLKNVIGK